MIGYNEYQEAANLLHLLLESRKMLDRFNMSDAEIAAKSKVDLQDAAAVKAAVADWYGELAAWAMQQQASGRYALCFSAAEKVQRKPYDLLARLEPLPKETQEAEVADALLRGLSPQERQRARRLYYRLLCIQPMRTLLARLQTLEEAMQQEGDARHAALLAEIGKPAFRAPIPPLQERRSGQALDVSGNDFTILDRLMDNWDRPLNRADEFVLPVALMADSSCPQTLLTAAVMHGLEAPEGARVPYQAIPGGHTSLGVYGVGVPEQFFRMVVKDQDRSRHRLMRVRGYAGVQLVQLTDETRRRFAGVAFSAAAIRQPVEKREDVFCARDAGGQEILPMLAQELQSRNALSGAACLEYFLKDKPLSEAQRQKALAELQAAVTEVFAQKKIPAGVTGEVRSVTYKSGKLAQRAVGLLLACVNGPGLKCHPCPGTQPPQVLLDKLERMKADEAAGRAFISEIQGMEAAGMKLQARFTAQEPRCVWIRCSAGVRHEAQERWLESAIAAAARGEWATLPLPPFDVAELEQICRDGLDNFLILGRKVGTGNSTFTLAVSDNGARHRDIYFRLLCLWCVHAGNGGQDVRLTPDQNSSEKTLFDLRKGPTAFVDMFARTDTDAESWQLTPLKLHSFLQQIVGTGLKILECPDGAFEIICGGSARPQG